ncbi:MAG TPA: hypothetical protein VG650_18145 [Mycobacteriales bacterium]|nr:hypothetical protein [Mycobacteriales bacterium]
MAALVVLGVLVALGVASALGVTVDSRDAGYGLGRVISSQQRGGQARNR